MTVAGIVGGSYTVTQPYGPTQFDGGYAYCWSYGSPEGQNVHCGLDIGLKRGHPLVAPGRGIVIVAGGTPYYTDAFNAAAGQLTLQLDDGTRVILGHLSEISVQPGQSVAQGQQVGLSGQGSTSEKNGHLHLEVRVRDSSLASGYRTVDPLAFFGP